LAPRPEKQLERGQSPRPTVREERSGRRAGPEQPRNLRSGLGRASLQTRIQHHAKTGIRASVTAITRAEIRRPRARPTDQPPPRHQERPGKSWGRNRGDGRAKTAESYGFESRPRPWWPGLASSQVCWPPSQRRVSQPHHMRGLSLRAAVVVNLCCDLTAGRVRAGRPSSPPLRRPRPAGQHGEHSTGQAWRARGDGPRRERSRRRGRQGRWGQPGQGLGARNQRPCVAQPQPGRSGPGITGRRPPCREGASRGSTGLMDRWPSIFTVRRVDRSSLPPGRQGGG